MNCRYHPIIEGLKINEDGSEIIYLGQKLIGKKINKTKGNTDTVLVNFNNYTLSVARLVCEAWHGMPENCDLNATRIEKEKGFHYTNLFWAKKGVNPNYDKIKFPRAKSSKIKEEEIPKIVKRLEEGETLSSIASDYNTSDMSISRIKKRYVDKK